MRSDYLLTYRKDGYFDFVWFDTEKELLQFIEKEKPDKIFDALKINDSDEIEID
jgi:hypothetical protein